MPRAARGARCLRLKAAAQILSALDNSRACALFSRAWTWRGLFRLPGGKACRGSGIRGPERSRAQKALADYGWAAWTLAIACAICCAWVYRRLSNINATKLRALLEG